MTIKDIARLSGCGVATVSRVLNDHPDVSDETRQKVMAVVEEHGFQPNANAKHLKQQTSTSIVIIVKGIMTPKAARKAKEAGASAIIVSNHGGRVLDQCPATAEVLEAIADEVGGTMKVLVDGGIRDGVDVFKALALGADAVLLARPFVNAVYRGEGQAVKDYVAKVQAELADTMAMCGAYALDEICKDMIWR